ncbi:MAG TPA: peptide chain release factor N(5)-glutamine methyltransferase [Candidatus Dormibacteraeota bacterium]|nr:peptide chain release factor N(5)-glutamine methyltransferase [Candidatus Dormibacteraeota bacterium]
MERSLNATEKDLTSDTGRTDSRLSLLEVLRRTTRALSAVGISQPRLEAELLLGSGLGLSRLDLYLQFERPLEESELDRIRPLLRSRSQGRPLAYILGRKEFYGLTFEVREGVLIPRPETELLVELGLVVADGATELKCVDLGCGTGCIGIAIAVSAASWHVDAVDLSESAVEIARSNAARLGVAERVAIFQGSWSGPLRDRGRYDLIVSNPPYVTGAEFDALDHGVRDFEPRQALDGGADGLGCYRELLAQLPKIIAPGATVLLEVDAGRATSVVELIARSWPGCAPQTHLDLSGRPRVVRVMLR